VLPLLKRAGITHLALETNDQARLDQTVRACAVTPATDGWFTAEPQRAALLRAPMTLHLPIVAFDMDEADHAWMEEHPDDSGEYRERRMAEHIIERILQKEPAARVLIWVGYGHAYKYCPPGRLKMMAAWLWELSGRNHSHAINRREGSPNVGLIWSSAIPNRATVTVAPRGYAPPTVAWSRGGSSRQHPLSSSFTSPRKALLGPPSINT